MFAFKSRTHRGFTVIHTRVWQELRLTFLGWTAYCPNTTYSLLTLPLFLDMALYPTVYFTPGPGYTLCLDWLLALALRGCLFLLSVTLHGRHCFCGLPGTRCLVSILAVVPPPPVDLSPRPTPFFLLGSQQSTLGCTHPSCPYSGLPFPDQLSLHGDNVATRLDTQGMVTPCPPEMSLPHLDLPFTLYTSLLFGDIKNWLFS